MYAITAQELHNDVVASLKRLCSYHRVNVMPETFAEAEKRPLIETITLCIYEYHASEMDKHEHFEKD